MKSATLFKYTPVVLLYVLMPHDTITATAYREMSVLSAAPLQWLPSVAPAEP